MIIEFSVDFFKQILQQLKQANSSFWFLRQYLSVKMEFWWNWSAQCFGKKHMKNLTQDICNIIFLQQQIDSNGLNLRYSLALAWGWNWLAIGTPRVQHSKEFRASSGYLRTLEYIFPLSTAGPQNTGHHIEQLWLDSHSASSEVSLALGWN